MQPSPYQQPSHEHGHHQPPSYQHGHHHPQPYDSPQPPAQPYPQPSYQQPPYQQGHPQPQPYQAPPPYLRTPPEAHKALVRKAKRDIGFGVAWSAFGLVVTVCAFARYGPYTIVAFGPMAYGIYLIIKGAVNLRRHA